MTAPGRDLNGVERVWFDLKDGVRRALVSDVRVVDGRFVTHFRCENRKQAQRAVSLWRKEPGTMQWLDLHLSRGDRFLDIGANVGVYTLSAAHRVGAEGHVYAFEPHKPNAVALMQNILRNQFQDRVTVLTNPLADARAFVRFNYRTMDVASTGSQLGATLASGKVFTPTVSELTESVAVDQLISAGVMPAPHLVKIDVDGIELTILRGMSSLLNSVARPRSVQVELNVGEQDAIVEFMAAHNYALDHRHFTYSGQRQLRLGKNESEIAHNAVFAAGGVAGA